MSVHARVFKVQSALGLLTMNWASTLERLSVVSYVDGYLVWNQIDRFWIDSDRKLLFPLEACANWQKSDFCSFVHGQAVEEIGSLLVELVREHELTYGEIWSILMDIRNYETQRHVQAERQPPTPI